MTWSTGYTDCPFSLSPAIAPSVSSHVWHFVPFYLHSTTPPHWLTAASGYGYGRVSGLCRFAHTRPCRPPGEQRVSPAWFILCRKAL